MLTYFKYGFMILSTSINSRLMKMGIFYHPKFDYTKENVHYLLKRGFFKPSPICV